MRHDDNFYLFRTPSSSSVNYAGTLASIGLPRQNSRSNFTALNFVAEQMRDSLPEFTAISVTARSSWQR